jgi:hypothetical protein
MQTFTANQAKTHLANFWISFSVSLCRCESATAG